MAHVAVTDVLALALADVEDARGVRDVINGDGGTDLVVHAGIAAVVWT